MERPDSRRNAEQAAVTYEGIRYHIYLYTCAEAVRQQWFERARENGSWAMPVVSQSVSDGTLLIRQSGSDQTIECRLVPEQLADEQTKRRYYEGIQQLKLEKKKLGSKKKVRHHTTGGHS